MKIQLSTDFHPIRVNLEKQLSSVHYNKDLRLLLNNIEGMVNELSKLEVEGRRLKKYSITTEQVNKINKAISYLEKLILFAKLMD